MDRIWHVAVADKTHGPYTGKVMRALHAAGKIHMHSRVWCEGLPDWVTYARSGLDPNRPLVVRPRVLTDARHGATTQTVVVPALSIADDGWQATGPTPWRRYLARMLDTLAIGAAMWAVIGVACLAFDADLYTWMLGEHGLVGNAVASSILGLVLMIPAQTFMLGGSGTTLGKYVFGIRVTLDDGRPIGYAAAWRRELSVFLVGLGGGIPLLSLATVLVARNRLLAHGTTAWDRGRPWVITHREEGAGQVLFVLAGGLLMVLIISWLGLPAGAGI